MSIIYDALKKVEASNIQNLKVKIPKDSKPIFKIYLVCILIVCAGAIIVSVFFGFFTKPLQITKPAQTEIKVVAENQTTAPTLPEKILVKEAEPVSLPEQKQLSPSFVLNGVFFSEDEGHALINNQIVKEGDVIAGATVKRIALNEVELESEGSIIKLSTNR